MKQRQKKSTSCSGSAPFRENAGLLVGPDSLKSRQHKGLPLITRAEYDDYYQVKSEGSTVATFNFMGYVEEDDGSLSLRDVTVVNGLRGVHIGIDGVRSYQDGMLNPPNKPGDIGEYVMYVTVPSAVQKREGVLCIYDDCRSVESFRKSEEECSAPEEIQSDIEREQSKTGWIVNRLVFKPKTDPEVRKRITILAMAITKFLQMGGGLDGLNRFVNHACSAIVSNTKMPDPETLLPEAANRSWERFIQDIFGS